MSTSLLCVFEAQCSHRCEPPSRLPVPAQAPFRTESVRGGGCPEQTLGTLPSLCPLNSVRPSAVTFQLFPEECELLKSGTACVECSMRPLLSLSSSRSHSCSAGCQLNGLQGSFLRSSFLCSSLLLVSSDPVCPSEEYLPASKGQLV